MNFFKEINRLESKYKNFPEAVVLKDALCVFTDYLQQLENQIKKKQRGNGEIVSWPPE